MMRHVTKQVLRQSSKLNQNFMPAAQTSVRFLNLHEYQSKDLMEEYGVNVQKGKMAESAADAAKVSKWIKEENPDAELILKGQIHAGGRGKGHFDSGLKGGVKICDTPEEVGEYTKQMLGYKLFTHQTGEEGQLCQKVLINEGISIDSEKYLAILMDRACNGPAIVASAKGGMDIEAVAEEDPDAIITEIVDPRTGVTAEQTKKVAEAIGFTGDKVAVAQKQISSLYDLFIGTDATQVEINPFAEGSVPGGDPDQIFCVDAKLNFDDNAAYRQKAIFDMRDLSVEDPRDVQAEKSGLNYIGLDGNIGCMVNGAGLAMATMDIIKLYGGDPANFLDVGGGASAKQVAEALELLTSDPKVEAILVNIFGGIMRCDTIAEGIIQAVQTVDLKVPLVVRVEGTNVEKARQMLDEANLGFITASDLDDAAQKAVAAIA
jgi:succinyl-CoA synthetase beta subunit